jgi:hypothetical protein
LFQSKVRAARRSTLGKFSMDIVVGKIVPYESIDGFHRQAIVQRMVESTIVAIDTHSNKEVVFDYSDHKEWIRKPYVAKAAAWNRDPRDVLGLKGCVVDEAKYFQDAYGYDKIVVRFTNGKTLVVTEEGQTGYFSYEVTKI